MDRDSAVAVFVISCQFVAAVFLALILSVAALIEIHRDEKISKVPQGQTKCS
jgi:hypothetical protein